MKEGYIKKENRKKILLLTDDIRVHSGVATVGREIVTHTAHRYNWVQLAGAIKHPDKNKIQDLSKATGDRIGIDDASVILYPCDHYGNPDLLRGVIEKENIDALFLITDPRYFEWVFAIENEIRSQIPIAYLNIWDDLPAPMYNREFYDSCDALFGISKQTKNINEMVLGEERCKNKVIRYIPHGLDHSIFKPINKFDSEFQKLKNSLEKDGKMKFKLLFNSRNIRRKCIPDTILAWKYFLDTLSKDERDKCQLVLHTAPIDDHGTDLPEVIKFLFPNNDHNIVISSGKFSTQQMSYLYNYADGTILLSSAEGWGLALTESLLTGTPIIANVTGGMQDQMRFTDEKGKWIEFNKNFPSNHNGTYRDCGEWALPVYPANKSLVGSPRTPYIWDDRCNAEDAAIQIKALYDMGDKERKRIGKVGRKWVLGDEAGFTAEKQAERVIEGMDELFKTFQPKPKFTFTKDADIDRKVLNHKLIY
jgi:glycosyltransferase involved in cell wall biosynthesis|tara:strand:- start:1856 stop:3289 length:1434 start_codon:yes stop_codon:yes gene_type:complete